MNNIVSCPSIPDSLLLDPCDITEAGDTVGLLAKGYIANASCIKEYQLLLEKQREYKSEMEKMNVR